MDGGSYPWGRGVHLYLFLWPQVFLGPVGEKKRKEQGETQIWRNSISPYAVRPMQCWFIAEAKPRCRDEDYGKGRQYQRMLECPAAVPRPQHQERWVWYERVHQREFGMPSNTREQWGLGDGSWHCSNLTGVAEPGIPPCYCLLPGTIIYEQSL